MLRPAGPGATVGAQRGRDGRGVRRRSRSGSTLAVDHRPAASPRGLTAAVGRLEAHRAVGLTPPTSVPRCSRNAARTRPPPSSVHWRAAAHRARRGRSAARSAGAGSRWRCRRARCTRRRSGGDVLERRDRQVPVRVLGLLQDRSARRGPVVVRGEDRVERRRGRWRANGSNDAIRHGPAGAAQRGLLAPLGVLLGRAPVDVVAVAGVHAAHVDALDRAGRRALEAGLALERAGLVVEQDQPAAVARRDVVELLRVLDGDLGPERLA